MERLDTSLFDDNTLGPAPQRVAGAAPCLTSIGPGGSLCITRTATGQDSLADAQP